MKRSGILDSYFSLGFLILLVLLAAGIVILVGWCFLSEKETVVLAFRDHSATGWLSDRAPRLVDAQGKKVWRIPVAAPGAPPSKMQFVAHNGERFEVDVGEVHRATLGRKRFAELRYHVPTRFHIRLNGEAASEPVHARLDNYDILGHLGERVVEQMLRPGEVWEPVAPRGWRQEAAELTFSNRLGFARVVAMKHPGEQPLTVRPVPRIMDVSWKRVMFNSPGLLAGRPGQVGTLIDDFVPVVCPSLVASPARMDVPTPPPALHTNELLVLRQDGSTPSNLWWRVSHTNTSWVVVTNPVNRSSGEFAEWNPHDRGSPQKWAPRVRYPVPRGEAQRFLRLEEAGEVENSDGNITVIPSGVHPANQGLIGRSGGKVGVLPGTNVLRFSEAHQPLRFAFPHSGVDPRFVTKHTGKVLTQMTAPGMLNLRTEQDLGAVFDEGVFMVRPCMPGGSWERDRAFKMVQFVGGPQASVGLPHLPAPAEALIAADVQGSRFAADAADADLLGHEAWLPDPGRSSATDICFTRQPANWIRGAVDGVVREAWSVSDLGTNSPPFLVNLAITQTNGVYLLQPFGERPKRLRFFLETRVDAYGVLRSEVDVEVPNRPDRILSLNLNARTPTLRRIPYERENLPIRVLLPDGRPAPDAQVGSTEPSEPSRQEAEGWKWLRLVNADKDGQIMLDVKLPGDTLACHYPVSIAEPEVVIQLPPRVQIRGRVDPPAPADSPFAEAFTVTALREVPPDWLPVIRRTHFWDETEVVCDASGRFALPHVREGKLVLEFGPRDHQVHLDLKGPTMEVDLRDR